MKIQEIRELAKSFNIKTARKSKQNLIHAIQIGEGNFNCFASAAQNECDQALCVWRTDCFTAAKK
ncbi:hypothetical protein MNBD_GAMMA07-2592 [hydrothermal vent metagenome]|uniref:SAP domain-containing protein n=1 Tax=hydrothermal vent metagenome TaxID=652676 RepID=A0A3B0WRM7_9ZZZZ